MPDNETDGTSEPGQDIQIGVINPFALAEVRLGRRIDWRRVSDPHALLEQVLGTPYERLFDPAAGSPLYPGIEVEPSTGQARKVASDSEIAALTIGLQVGSGPESGAAAPVGSSDADLPLPGQGEVSVGAETWVDTGDFFHDTTEVFDPVQGAVADCYLIAGLSSVAWARPYLIAQRNRAVDNAGSFLDLIQFFDAGNVVGIEVSEKLPVNPPANTLKYCRSSDPGEIWPGVYEKAFAKWRTNDATDQPNIPAIAFGDPNAATQRLTGLIPTYFGSEVMTADAIWTKVRENCLSMKTFNPMTAWTYGTSDPAKGRVYASANLVANHAYSILGWAYVDGQKYVVVRNPWGSTEATLNITNGSWVAWDAPYSGPSGSYPTAAGRGFWRTIPLSNNDGVFALRADTFKTYYAGFGVCK